MTLHQYDYIFAIAMLFAFLDAWSIGANDVANSFATTVSSRAITLPQAMAIASVCEFLGAVLAGSRVADTVRNKIISVDDFTDNPEVLMLAMMCALIGSSTWLTLATKLGLPVSTTHCIVGAIIGAGIACLGVDGVSWSWEKKGVAQILASWVIAPAIAGAFAALTFLLTKYAVLKRKNPLKAGLITVPFYYGLTSAVLTMLVVWKGAANLDLDDWSTGRVVGCIIGVSGGCIALALLFFVPYYHRMLALEDWTLKPYHIFLGPLLWRRGPVPEAPEGVTAAVVKDYYSGVLTREQLEELGVNRRALDDLEHSKQQQQLRKRLEDGEIVEHDAEGTVKLDALPNSEPLAQCETRDVGPWYLPKNLWELFVAAFMHGVRKDVVASQKENSKIAGSRSAILDMHARAAHFDNKTEHLYSFLQVLTAATGSFAHGANDLANAVGPLSAVFLVWSTGSIQKKSPVPIWVLVYGASAICIGLWTYGYNLMRNLGNRLTLMSPSRGFSMELGYSMTVLMASRLGIPVSTTQCAVGGIMGVALCNGDLKALNWRMIGWCYAGWIFTLPITGTISGVLVGIIINAPRIRT